MSPSTSALKRGRGRPQGARGRRPSVSRRFDTVEQWIQRTGKSRSTADRYIRDGILRCVQEVPGGLRLIPHSEYERLGYGEVEEA
jgi:predicted DNA-binding transcriptional regulator AlpA